MLLGFPKDGKRSLNPDCALVLTRPEPYSTSRMVARTVTAPFSRLPRNRSSVFAVPTALNPKFRRQLWRECWALFASMVNSLLGFKVAERTISRRMHRAPQVGISTTI